MPAPARPAERMVSTVFAEGLPLTRTHNGPRGPLNVQLSIQL